jgi:hypothetical protein
MIEKYALFEKVTFFNVRKIAGPAHLLKLIRDIQLIQLRSGFLRDPHPIRRLIPRIAAISTAIWR